MQSTSDFLNLFLAGMVLFGLQDSDLRQSLLFLYFLSSFMPKDPWQPRGPLYLGFSRSDQVSKIPKSYLSIEGRVTSIQCFVSEVCISKFLKDQNI